MLHAHLVEQLYLVLRKRAVEVAREEEVELHILDVANCADDIERQRGTSSPGANVLVTAGRGSCGVSSIARLVPGFWRSSR